MWCGKYYFGKSVDLRKYISIIITIEIESLLPGTLNVKKFSVMFSERRVSDPKVVSTDPTKSCRHRSEDLTMNKGS